MIIPVRIVTDRSVRGIHPSRPIDAPPRRNVGARSGPASENFAAMRGRLSGGRRQHMRPKKSRANECFRELKCFGPVETSWHDCRTPVRNRNNRARGRVDLQAGDQEQTYDTHQTLRCLACDRRLPRRQRHRACGGRGRRSLSGRRGGRIERGRGGPEALARPTAPPAATRPAAPMPGSAGTSAAGSTRSPTSSGILSTQGSQLNSTTGSGQVTSPTTGTGHSIRRPPAPAS